MSFLPLPVVDLDRPWGNPDCTECSGICHGHYLKPEIMLHNHSYVYSLPPSVEIQQFFMQLKGRQPTEDELTVVAQKVLLPTSEVQIWLDHLHEVQRNRQRGAAKAAETRRAKRAAKEHAESTPTQLQSANTSTATPTQLQPTYTSTATPTQLQPANAASSTSESGEENVYCGVCGGPYEKVTDDVEDWIGCDGCEQWLHWVCAGITEEPESFLCTTCKNK